MDDKEKLLRELIKDEDNASLRQQVEGGLATPLEIAKLYKKMEEERQDAIDKYIKEMSSTIFNSVFKSFKGKVNENDEADEENSEVVEMEELNGEEEKEDQTGETEEEKKEEHGTFQFPDIDLSKTIGSAVSYLNFDLGSMEEICENFSIKKDEIDKNQQREIRKEYKRQKAVKKRQQEKLAKESKARKEMMDSAEIIREASEILDNDKISAKFIVGRVYDDYLSCTCSSGYKKGMKLSVKKCRKSKCKEFLCCTYSC